MNQTGKIILWILPVAGLAAGFASSRLMPGGGGSGRGPLATENGILSQGQTVQPGQTPAAQADGERRAGDRPAAGLQSSGDGGTFSEDSLDAILKIPGVLHRRYALREYFDGLSAGEFPKTLAALQSYRGMLDTQAILLLFRSWFIKAPDDAVKYTKEVPLDEGRGDLISAGMRAWARIDPAAARAYAPKLPDRERDEILRYINSISGLQTPIADPVAAIRQILAEPNVPNNKIWSVFVDWATRDPVAAAREAAKLPDASYRASVLRSMAYYWAEKDARGAMAWVDSLPDGIDRVPLKVQVARALSVVEPGTARDYAMQLPDGKERSELLVMIANQWLRTDTASAVAMVREVAGAQGAVQFASFFTEWAKTEPENAVRAFVEMLPPADQRQTRESGLWKTVANVLDPWVKKDPIAAAKFATDLPQAERYEVFARVAWDWCRTDAPAAGAWAQSLPTGQARSEMLEQVAYAWGVHDSTAVTKWLDALPAGGGKNAAIEGFALATFNTDADGSIEWLRNAASEKESSADRVARVWGYWAERNPGAARGWLDSSTQITDAERAAIEKRIKN